MRTPRNTPLKFEHDMSLLIPKEVREKLANSVAEDDCFGKEWDVSTRECSLCADNELCGIIYADLVAKKVKKFESENPTPMDLADFAAINKDRLYKVIKKKAEEKDPFTKMEIVDYVKTSAKSDDEVAIVQWLLRFKEEYKLKFLGGYVYAS